jgi:hypothetical protein
MNMMTHQRKDIGADNEKQIRHVQSTVLPAQALNELLKSLRCIPSLHLDCDPDWIFYVALQLLHRIHALNDSDGIGCILLRIPG